MNNFIVFDTETTGLPDWKSPSGAENQPHIVQLAAHLVDADKFKILQTMDVIVKPDGWVIPDVVTEIHGISTEYASDIGVPEEVALDLFLELWRKSNTRVAHNVRFDNRIIRIATKRYCGDELIDQCYNGDYECTGLLSTQIMKMEPKNRVGFKMPKLSEAYKHFTGIKLQNAHTAIADTNACLAIYSAIQKSL